MLPAKAYLADIEAIAQSKINRIRRYESIANLLAAKLADALALAEKEGIEGWSAANRKLAPLGIHGLARVLLLVETAIAIATAIAIEVMNLVLNIELLLETYFEIEPPSVD